MEENGYLDNEISRARQTGFGPVGMAYAMYPLTSDPVSSRGPTSSPHKQVLRKYLSLSIPNPVKHFR